MSQRTFFAYCLLLCGLALQALVSGCAPRPAFGDCAYRMQTGDCYPDPHMTANLPTDEDLIVVMGKAAEALLKNLSEPLQTDQRLLVTSIADLNHLEKSTALGRLLGEQLAAQLTVRGYQVIDPRTREDLSVQHKSGEFILSRNLERISREHSVYGIATGTYSVAAQSVYITLKLIRPDGLTLSSYLFRLPLGPDTQRLLHNPE
ncbi:FlgO family outer membrane protein [Candidatus Venteria ishoeyi]|uniref:FlgO domain-containing protein n=1 Tax=Candidatus Venteria ishoeyi TaxID=1899563 RepID=A0A1H6FD71_9GAMM|nr:FlgO family outer membrane protein [Candidatus Venteria ishoeyi]MDM8545506.1 FlgO family outer membrane protein [Candidatus Venteria ishoeyi]SEH07593.1 Uncharacterised protein [Candidatus Venteria ishoeyi]